MALQTPATACPTHEEDLVLFHYGELAGAELAAIQTHVTTCTGCATYLNELATLLPLTVKADDPPQEFWMNYNRELRHKIDEAADKPSWWGNLSLIFRPRLITAFVASPVIVMALTFTLGRNHLPTNDNHSADDEVAVALFEAYNKDFYIASVYLGLLYELSL